MNRKFFYGALILIALGFFGSFFLMKSQTSKVRIGDNVFSVEIAETPETRAQGLGDRASIGANNGMLFLFDAPGNYGFWMKDMRFSIDIMWIKDNKVVGFAE